MPDPHDNEPISERYRILGEEWADAKAAADLLEESKTLVLAQRITKVIEEAGDIPYNRAELKVKSSPEWEDYIKKMVHARKVANRLKVNLDYLEIKRWEYASLEANKRLESRL